MAASKTTSRGVLALGFLIGGASSRLLSDGLFFARTAGEGEGNARRRLGSLDWFISNMLTQQRF